MDWNSDLAAGITGTSANQLGHMVRLGIVEPAAEASRRGVSHRFDFKNLVEMTIGAEFFDAGITAFNVAEAVRRVQENWTALCNPETRDEVAVLALLRSPGDARPNRTDLGDTPVNLLTLMGPVNAFQDAWIVTGYTVHAAINVKWIIDSLERITRVRCA